MSKLQTICTEEELKMWTTVPGEIQAISTNRAQNEKINPFLRAKVGHKVDMKEKIAELEKGNAELKEELEKNKLLVDK
ncbi:12814_t:CDS:2 [Entrophospora sp. SA101]|nr:12814_t:CDS:2 [Entrophospora sp. SA101]